MPGDMPMFAMKIKFTTVVIVAAFFYCCFKYMYMYFIPKRMDVLKIQVPVSFSL